MKILMLKHFAFDDESALAAWADLRGHAYAVIDPSQEGILPDPNEFDLLVILGGPMSVYQEDELPWLVREKRFVKEAAHAGKCILGICLGGQMLADVLGGKVYRSEHKEIGFHEIRRTAERHPLFDGMPETFRSFQWHGDAFDLPPGAVPLASSSASRHQAFAYGASVLALQFHLETTRACIGVMLERWSKELADAPYIQQADEIRAQLARIPDSHAMLHGLLDRLEETWRASRAAPPPRTLPSH